MEQNKKWFEGFKWAESVFKEMFFYEALEHVLDKILSEYADDFDKGAFDYCTYVQDNIDVFRYRFNDERIFNLE